MRHAVLVGVLVGLGGVGLRAQNPVSVTQIGTTAVDVNSGSKSAGTQRIVIATDQPALTNPWAIIGNVADAATDSGAPVKIGALFETTPPTYTTGQRTTLHTNNRGDLFVTAGTSGLTVTANAGTNLNTSALALDTSVNGLLLSQGSTTSGQKGPLAQGAVTTNAPSYTTGQTSPLSLDPSGLLRASLKDTPSNTNNLNVNLAASAATVTVSGTVTTSPPANASENVAQFGGTNVSTGTGTGGAGIPRVTVSSDSTLTSIGSITNTVTAQGTLTNNNAAPSTNNLGALVARATAAAPTYTDGNMVTLSTDTAGALRVSGSSGGGVAQTQVRDLANNWQDVGYQKSNAQMPVYDSVSYQTLQQLLLLLQQQTGYLRGNFGGRIGSVNDALKVYAANPQDPCIGTAKGNIAISQTATTKLVAGIPGLRIFVCTARVVAGAAEIVNFTEGTGTTCGTAETAVSGSTTTANGESYAANGGFQSGAGAAVMITSKAGDDLCLKQNGANRLAGNLTYAYVP